jgi:hypothetical protein
MGGTNSSEASYDVLIGKTRKEAEELRGVKWPQLTFHFLQQSAVFPCVFKPCGTCGCNTVGHPNPAHLSKTTLALWVSDDDKVTGIRGLGTDACSRASGSKSAPEQFSDGSLTIERLE